MRASSLALLAALLGACLLAAPAAAQAPGIGDRLLHTYFQFSPFPITVEDAKDQGWSAEGGDSSCDPDRGVAYANGGALSSSQPVRLYFTKGGQIAGFGLRTTLAPAATLTSFWEQDPSGFYILSVAFRNSTVMCSGAVEDAPLGYGPVVINQGALNLGVPMTDDAAYEGQWTNGSCISKMGRHWGYDLATAPVLSGKSANLVPLLPMYSIEGNLVTMLIEVPDVERVEPLGMWEGPFPSLLFCKNFCGGCSLDATFTSTMHFFLGDPSLQTCPPGC